MRLNSLYFVPDFPVKTVITFIVSVLALEGIVFESVIKLSIANEDIQSIKKMHWSLRKSYEDFLYMF